MILPIVYFILYSNENPTAVKMVEQSPQSERGADGEQEALGRAAERAEAAEKMFVDVAKAKQRLNHIRNDGIGTNHLEWESPAFEPQRVNHSIEQRQQEQTPAAGPEHHGAGPQVLDVWQNEAQSPSQYQTGQTHTNKDADFPRVGEWRA